MAPANIPMFLSQKPSTKNGIIRHVCSFILSVATRSLRLDPTLARKAQNGQLFFQVVRVLRALRPASAPSLPPRTCQASRASGIHVCSSPILRFSARNTLKTKLFVYTQKPWLLYINQNPSSRDYASRLPASARVVMCPGEHPRTWRGARAQRGFHPAELLVHNSSTGNNGTTG